MRKKFTLNDLRQAELDPQLKFKMSQKSSAKGILSGTDLLNIQKFARMNLPLAKQRESKITQQSLVQNLTKVISSRRPDVRKTLLSALDDYINSK